MEYDAQVTDCATGTLTKPHAIRQAGAYGFTYDCNGNMLTRPEADGIYTQTWDEENRLQSVTVNGQTTTFGYDGDGQRIKRVAPDGTTYYVGNHYEKFVPASIPTPTAIAATRAPTGLTMMRMPCVDFCVTTHAHREEGHAYADCDGDTYADCDRDAHAHRDDDSHRDGDTYADCDRDAHVHCDRDAYAHRGATRHGE